MATSRVKKAVKKVTPDTWQAAAPKGWKENVKRTLKAFIVAAVTALIGIGTIGANDIKSICFVLVNTTITFVLNIILKWASTE